MQTAANRQPERLPKWQFSLRFALGMVAAACVFLAIGRRIGLEWMFLLASAAVLVAVIWLASRKQLRCLGFLLLIHLAIGSFLLLGPIASYHINGRAWYDYGVSDWNPPISHDDDGRTWLGDYDPKFTPPATWPIIGPIMCEMSWLSIGLMIIPPTAPVVMIATPIMIMRLSKTLTRWQKSCVWIIWAVGSLPTLYMLLWGSKVGSWIAD